ncbi:MAG TPA: Co2+/Mg2+ efflux protein ApaG [Casimicrobiaceae bacterium]|nr:Co2+/Mg2+ efflux protein ApaG [Casimicrobiaceae bacterium]
MEDARYGMRIEPVVRYVADQSDPARGQYVFAYTIRITNVGSLAAKLVSRHWVITDGEHRVQEVRGEGVVGEQPTIAPGETYEYSSGASIATPVGTMRGSYRMVATDGCEFDAPIERFTLSVPRTLH